MQIPYTPLACNPQSGVISVAYCGASSTGSTGALLSCQAPSGNCVPYGNRQDTNGNQVLVLGENQSTYIPLGQTHRLANPGKVPLEIIEVQSGSYLGEDDIVRLEDTYGRVAEKNDQSMSGL